MSEHSLRIASESLRQNILHLPSGKYVTAGQNQFLTLWTRDFCHSVRGLLALGEIDVAKNHLSFLLTSLRADGLVPRVVDNRLVQFRVSWQSARKLLPFLPRLSLHDPLKPQYTDEHGSCAIDSNLLLLIAALQVREKDLSWWETHEADLKKVFAYYHDKFQNGFIYQTAFADWQDSAKREGVTFLTNLFYFMVASSLQKMGWTIETNLCLFKSQLKEMFIDKKSGLFFSLKGSDIISLDGNLFALETESFLTAEEKNLLWKNLTSHPVMNLCSVPDYKDEDIAFHVRLARLNGYHGHLAWSWLLGLTLKVAILMKDEKIIHSQKALIDSLLLRDQSVLEIYVPHNNWQGWESWLLRSERPFAWGASYLIESLSCL